MSYCLFMLKMEINGSEVKPMKIYIDDFFDTIRTFSIQLQLWAKQNCDRRNVL